MSGMIEIASDWGLIVPGHLLNKCNDVSIAPHASVAVPVAYGRSLIADGFAYAVNGEEPVDDVPKHQDAYDEMDHDELISVAEEIGFDPDGRWSDSTLRENIRKEVARIYSDLDERAKSLGVDVDDDWTLEEYREAIASAEKDK